MRFSFRHMFLIDTEMNSKGWIRANHKEFTNTASKDSHLRRVKTNFGWPFVAYIVVYLQVETKIGINGLKYHLTLEVLGGRWNLTYSKKQHISLAAKMIERNEMQNTLWMIQLMTGPTILQYFNPVLLPIYVTC